MLNKPDPPADKKEPVVIKKYANRRLYNTETSTYVTLDDLAAMVRADRDFVVFDAKTGDDLTHAVLTQIIVEQESRMGGQTLLPIPFLRQLIRFYGDSIGRMVPSYLQISLETLTKEQERFRKQFASAFSIRLPPSRPTRSRRARTWRCSSRRCRCGPRSRASAARPRQAVDKGVPEAKAVRIANEISELKSQLASMQQKIDKLSEDRD